MLLSVLHALLALLWPDPVARQLLAENLALRQQLTLLRHKVRCVKPGATDRLFWVALSRLWPAWRSALAIFRPATVLSWHRSGFRLFWTWRSRGGRPPADLPLRTLIRRLARKNPTWGAPRIHGEILKLGLQVAESTVSKYLPRRSPGPPSPTWRAFVQNHLDCSAAIDFLAIPTATFQLLHGFVVLDHARRKILAVEVTAHPTSEWTANTLLAAFPYDSAPRFLFRDRDAIYGHKVPQRLRAMAIEEVISAPRSPWQNAYVERVIGTLRRELLDHVIVLGEDHARRLLREYAAYHNADRTHLGLFKDTPLGREVEPPSKGTVRARPILGGLHHRYFRSAA